DFIWVSILLDIVFAVSFVKVLNDFSASLLNDKLALCNENNPINRAEISINDEKKTINLVLILLKSTLLILEVKLLYDFLKLKFLKFKFLKLTFLKLIFFKSIFFKSILLIFKLFN